MSFDKLTDLANQIHDTAGKYEIRWDDNNSPSVWRDGQQVQDYSWANEHLDRLQGVIGGFGELGRPTWDTHQDQYNQYRQGFDSMLDQFMSPAQRNQDISQARNYAAENLGYENWNQYHQDIGNMRGQLNQGINAQEGLSDLERQRYQEFQERQALDMRDNLNRQVEAVMASTGSTMNFLMAADEARKQISNERLRGELSIMQEDFQRKTMQYESLKDQLWNQVQAGTISQEQFLQGIRQDRMSALQGYAMGMDQVMQKYHMELMAYTTDLDALRSEAGAIMDLISAQLGVDQAAISTFETLMAAEINPLIAQFDSLAGILSLQMQDAQLKHDTRNWWQRLTLQKGGGGW